LTVFPQSVEVDTVMALTNVAAKAAKYEGKPFKLYDEKGLYLLVNASGKYWRYDYRFAEKRRTLALGVYPELTLAEARLALTRAKDGLLAGKDPVLAKQSATPVTTGADSFENVAREWMKSHKAEWGEGHESRVRRAFEMWAFPWIGQRRISTLSAPDLLSVARRIEDAGRLEMAHRVTSTAGQVFRYAIACGYCASDPTRDLRGALKSYKSKPRAAITSADRLADVLLAIDGYMGTMETRTALALLPHVFVRPGELRFMEWSEIDFNEQMWSIPAAKMKTRLPHLVPLSRQSLALLHDIQPLTGRFKYVMPGARDKNQPLSDATYNAVLRRLGFSTQDDICAHGFRSVGSTFLHEMGFPSEAIEVQLAHKIGGVKGVYMRGQFLDVRVRMMQEWSDRLDLLKRDRQLQRAP